MRPIALIATVTLSLGWLTSAAMAEPAAVKTDSAAIEAAKATSLNRMSLGVYRSLRVSRTNTATALNASLKSAASGAAVDPEQKLGIERDSFTNRKMTSNSANRSVQPQLQSLNNAEFATMGLSSAAVPDTARMNKLH
jgi:hypothetical protein